MKNPKEFPLGEMITLSYQDPLSDNNPTTRDAIIVRQADDGIAVAYIEIDEL